MFSVQSARPGQLDRLYYGKDRLKIGDVGNQFQESNADSVGKGEREMGVCEMQVEYMRAIANEQRALHDLQLTEWQTLTSKGEKFAPPDPLVVHQPLTVGIVYCRALYGIDRLFKLKSASVKQVATSRMTSIPPQSASMGTGALDVPPPTVSALPAIATMAATATAATAAAAAAAHLPRLPSLSSLPQKTRASFEFSEANLRHEDAIHHQARMGVEIEKKFSLAAACIVFVLVGAPIALRFPRGGVGLVLAVSFVVFGAYYVGLIGGESLANKNLMSPFWAMWGANVVFMLGGIPLLLRMGRESSATRGGGFAQLVDSTRAWFNRVTNQGS
jgi:lipopolysaccharide export system permease protein